MTTRKRALVAVMIVCSASFPALAADGLRGANSLAMGAVAVANATDNAATAANAAMLALEERYDLAGTFDVSHAGDLGWHITAADSTRSRAAFAMGWQRRITNPPPTAAELPGWTVAGVDPVNARRTSLFTAALAYALDEDRTWSVGLSGRVGRVRHDRLGDSLSGDLDVGVGWHPSEEATLGAVVQGVLPIGGILPSPITALVGARYAMTDGPSVAADVGWQLEDASGLGLLVRTGLEVAAGPVRPRLGLRYDGPDRLTTLSGGVGVENEQGAFDYAILVPVGHQFSVQGIVHVISLRIRT